MSKGTRRHAIRIDDALWESALAVAKARKEHLSEIIRQALCDYINKHKGEK